MTKIFYIILLPIFFHSSLANALEWKIQNAQSKIEFTVIQNKLPINGSFKNFSGIINFDKNNLKSSKVEINIDTNSITSSNSNATDTAKTPSWLSSKAFPKAIFYADKFKKLSDTNYLAEGKLTIKEKTIPLILNFMLEKYDNKAAKAVGVAKIKRSDFAIGDIDQNKSYNVEDDIIINFEVNALAKI